VRKLAVFRKEDGIPRQLPIGILLTQLLLGKAYIWGKIYMSSTSNLQKLA
jgi:hypothetical protein